MISLQGNLFISLKIIAIKTNTRIMIYIQFNPAADPVDDIICSGKFRIILLAIIIDKRPIASSVFNFE